MSRLTIHKFLSPYCINVNSRQVYSNVFSNSSTCIIIRISYFLKNLCVCACMCVYMCACVQIHVCDDGHVEDILQLLLLGFIIHLFWYIVSCFLPCAPSCLSHEPSEYPSFNSFVMLKYAHKNIRNREGIIIFINSSYSLLF